ncbi:nucleoside diphosphate-linked moiety X motif 17 [Bombina bombina]|uniref:nucleoside diphosphate-linked moiety X motif 17 n=1 Tax=Bombina bombina TaxID=8345 RepID=UPI00235A54A3|nr:nucleoside diphosphate-linked moiety X motif 17 [Bombina bombina]XP_053560495.1 nucleoside diphosphate-linked moiety X motif 17 [Bombina bombina]
METAKRVLVYLSKENSPLWRAKFVQGVLGIFAGNQEDNVFVSCGLEKNKFVISDNQFSGSYRVNFQRPSFCPIKNLTSIQVASLPEEVQNRGVDVGVAVIVQSVNKKILLTRRSKTLNIFPNVWVPPGGHIEDGEELLQAGLRELHEETGLHLQEGHFSWSILGLWESAFPPMLSRGLPKRHHIVTYLLVQSTETHLQLQERLYPDEQEVTACAWLDSDIVKHIAAVEDRIKNSGKDMSNLPTTVRITEVNSGSLTQTDLSTATFFNTVPEDGEDVERVSTGTNYALRLWLDTLSTETL